MKPLTAILLILTALLLSGCSSPNYWVAGQGKFVVYDGISPPADVLTETIKALP